MQKNQQKIRCADPSGSRRRRFVRRFGPFPGPGFCRRCAGLFACLVLSLALAMPLAATEHRGVVKFAGLPVPGVTVTASQADKKLTAITDDQGVYTFPNLSDGLWNIQVEMQCFETIKREIAVAPDSPSPQWDLKLQSFDEIKASAPAPAPSAPNLPKPPPQPPRPQRRPPPRLSLPPMPATPSPPPSRRRARKAPPRRPQPRKPDSRRRR